MCRRPFHTVLLLILFASLGLLACDVSTLTSLGLGAPKPLVTIQSPVAGAQFQEGDDVTVQSTSTDKSGIVRVELSVDGAVVRADAPPIAQGQTSFSVIQTWKAAPGNHTLSVRAFNASGAASDPVLVAITVASAAAVLPSSTFAPTLMPLGGTPVNPATLQTPTLSPSGSDTTPTKRPPTHTPSPTTISAPPGVWALSIRVDPTAPKRGQNVTFYVTFLNTTGSPQGYRWRIRIFYPDNLKNSFGDTTVLPYTIAVGTSELASDNGWKVTGPGDCLQFLARVFSVDPNTKQETEFLKPDQSGGPATQFPVCP